jgi:DNA-binding beta-propeller fold protein YncE
VSLALVAMLSGLVGGCRSPVPFRGRPGPGDPVPALGAPVPYVRTTPSPPVVDQRGGLADPPSGVYAFTQAGMLGPVARTLPGRVYVPSADGVDVVDPATFRVVRRISLGRRPRQVIPSWDLRTLWVSETGGLVPVDARTGAKGRKVSIAAVADLYFSPDGSAALVLDARHGRIEVRDPHTMRYRSALTVPCAGLTHADFSSEGDALVVGCTTGRLALVDLTRRRATRTLRLATGSTPQDVRLSPDGTTYYVADTSHGGVWLVDALRFQKKGFVRTGRGANGLYPSRDATTLYVTGSDTIALISFARQRRIGRWKTPASPGAAAVSATGRILWLSAWKTGAVYAISTRTGHAVRKVTVGARPSGLCLHPQPGRFSLGHTGNYR